MPLILGGFVFEDFELPKQVPLGGAQRQSTHELLGGARVVDAMGPSERDITWSGRFQKADAWIRARTLDAMRIAGQPLPLTINEEFRTVLITEFHPEYQTSYQVLYSITLLVVDNPNTSFGGLSSLDTVIATDVASVVSLVANFASF